MENDEAIHVQPNSRTTMGPATAVGAVIAITAVCEGRHGDRNFGEAGC
jgi:hypothetical protein